MLKFSPLEASHRAAPVRSKNRLPEMPKGMRIERIPGVVLVHMPRPLRFACIALAFLNDHVDSANGVRRTKLYTTVPPIVMENIYVVVHPAVL